jgi:hypothetical protein
MMPAICRWNFLRFECLSGDALDRDSGNARKFEGIDESLDPALFNPRIDRLPRRSAQFGNRGDAAGELIRGVKNA